MQQKYNTFLLKEYAQISREAQYVYIGKDKYIIPYSYMKDYKQPTKAFLDDALDSTASEISKYNLHDEEPRYISWQNENKKITWIVPFSLRKKTDQEIIQSLSKKVEKKLSKAIRRYQRLSDLYPTHTYSFKVSKTALKEYNKICRKINEKNVKNKTKELAQNLIAFLSKNIKKATHNIKNATPKQLKKAAKIFLATMFTGAVIAGSVYIPKKIEQVKHRIEIAHKLKEQDIYGNIKMIEQCRNEIKVSLAFVENFAPNTFKDGGGVKTIGYGTTFYIDEQGNGNIQSSEVGDNDSITIKDADIQKDRYINEFIIPQIQKNVKVPMDKKTTIATANFLYVIGGTKFAKSKYLEALNQGITGEELANYMTGFRKQKGLLPRFYFLAEILKGNLTAKNLLNIQAEGCYNLTLKDVCVYKNGKLLVDKNNLAQFKNGVLEENLKKAQTPRRSVALGGEYCEPVRNIMLPEIVEDVEKNKNKNPTYYILAKDLSI